MFRKVLIANRGEIAVRVMRTCHEMGVATVAVYSEADAGGLHVAMADEAVRIGGPESKESYLRGNVIIQAALATGAEAIHPGYGFLSENPGFAEDVQAAGLVFVGPSAEAIRAMGLKDAAKRAMAAAGVPVLPGYDGEDQTPERLATEAAAIGYPLMIKAVAGGGGKGMRQVAGPDAFEGALRAARREAETAFGNGAVLLERFVETPRHIEVQVFGDGTRAVHLFERDCSLQRRHQKVIEEAPAPGMTAEMRSAMGAAAVRAAEAIGYQGAGTVEFIVDGSKGLRPDGFWFMEMNTRLQVEHPVTEAITGVDLVAWQLRVAAGETLPKTQDELSFTGHAFEARLYAEDPANDFLPVTGRLAHVRFPEGARAESGVRAGDAISPWYDPMIAKIVAHGETREIALGQLARALAATEIAGTVTNLSFLRRLSAHGDVQRGAVDTGLIARAGAALTQQSDPTSQVYALGALAALGLDEVAGPFQGFALWAPLWEEVRLRFGEEDVLVQVATLGPATFEVRVAEATHHMGRTDHGWQIDGTLVAARTVRTDAGVSVFWHDHAHLQIVDPLDRDAGETKMGVIEAPMPGLIKALAAKVGAEVHAGDALAVLEAMKMEHVLAAPRDGTIADVSVSEGDQVEAGAQIVRLSNGA